MKELMKKQRLLTDRYYNVMDNYTKTLDMAKLGYKFARYANASSRKLWKLPSIREKITSLSIENIESNKLYSEIIDDILGTFQEASVIIKDSELAFPFTACVNLIMTKEMAGKERAIIISFVAGKKPATQSEIEGWMVVSKGQEALLAVLNTRLQKKCVMSFKQK